MTSQRRVISIQPGQPASDGAGVRLNRVIGGPGLERFDPFLMLDEFSTDNPDDYIAGFPPHPHRGFETITYMLEGRMRKFFEESVLTKQAFVLNPDQSVEEALKEAEKAAGAPIKLAGFVRFAVGEGVEKRQDDFAAEVASMTKKD